MILNEVLNQTLPFEIVKFGNGTDRTITIVGGQHGNERIGVQVALSLAEWLQQFNLKGQICVIPFANPEALAIDQREYDGIDMNRRFDSADLPSNILNRISQIKNCIKQSELVIDCHGASHAEEIKWPFVLCHPNDKKFGRAFPTDIAVSAAPEGSLRDYCLKLSIPCLTLEGIDSQKKETIKIAMIGLFKLLREFNFIG